MNNTDAPITAREVIDEAGRATKGKHKGATKLTKKELFCLHRADMMQYQIDELKLKLASYHKRTLELVESIMKVLAQNVELAKQNGELAARLDAVLAARSVDNRVTVTPAEAKRAIEDANKDFVERVRGPVEKKILTMIEEKVQAELPTQPFKGGAFVTHSPVSIFNTPTC